jgi:hypothetical protein
MTMREGIVAEARASLLPKTPSPPRQNEHLRPIHARFMEAQLALSIQ